MIIARAPLRITLGGGGTDIASYYCQHGGGCISAAITRYVYITIHDNFSNDLIVKYSQLERVKDASEIKHPIIREAMDMLGLDGRGMEITSMADIPAGTVDANPLPIKRTVSLELEDNLLLFFTSYSRNASDVLRRSGGDMAAFSDAIGRESLCALKNGDLPEFGRLLDLHWQRKRSVAGMSSTEIDNLYSCGMANGAIGGKLVGAGGGGFLMFLAEDRKALRKAMYAQGLREVGVKFDYEGVKLLNV